MKARRKELGLTQEQLALRGDLQQRWISNVETGKRNPSYASLRRLAVLLELTTAEMIDRAEASERNFHSDKSSQHAESPRSRGARTR